MLLLLTVLGFTLPMTVSMLVGEKPNCFRASGVIGPSVVLAASALQRLRRAGTDLVSQLPSSLHVAWAQGESERGRATILLPLAILPMLFCVGLITAEFCEVRRYYFHDFRQVAPDMANYSIALRLAEIMAGFEDGPAYVRSWPHWYDGRAVQEHLGGMGETWAGELFELQPDKEPLAGFQGKMLVLLHPHDRETLTTLKAFFPRHATNVDRFPDGAPAIISFYGQR